MDSDKVGVMEAASISSLKPQHGLCGDTADTSEITEIADSNAKAQTPNSSEITVISVCDETTENSKKICTVDTDVASLAKFETQTIKENAAGDNMTRIGIEEVADSVKIIDKVELITTSKTIDNEELNESVIIKSDEVASIEVTENETLNTSNDNENSVSEVELESSVENEYEDTDDNAVREALAIPGLESSEPTVINLVDYNDDSVSEPGSDHASGNEASRGSDSDSVERNHRKTRRITPHHFNDDITSTDGDHGDGTGDEGTDEQGHAHDEELQEESLENKETPQPPRKVDDDEDKNNPQYIPKRGTFYEHDYRTTEDVAEEEKVDADNEKTDGSADSKKKMWQDKREKWSHDKFKDEDQLPKSREELIAIYGYDIRNEDGPPRARRRRRYGRGPNKYTRNWEDEDAYYKTAVKKPPQQTRGGEQLNQQQEASPQPIRNNPKPERIRDQPPEREQSNMSQDARSGQVRVQQSAGTGRILRPNREYASSDYKSFTKARNYNRSEQHTQQRPQRQAPAALAYYQQNRFSNETGSSSDSHPVTANTGRFPRQHQSQDNRETNVSQLDAGMSSLSLQQQQQQYDLDSNEQRPADRKPASKRYSSIRQRPFPETSKPITLSEAFAVHHKINAEMEQRERMAVQQQHYYEQPVAAASAMCAPSPLGLPPLSETALAQQMQLQPPPPQRFVAGVPALPPTIPMPQYMARAPQPLPRPPINLNYQLAPQHYYQHQQAPPPPQFVAQPMTSMQPQQVAAEQLFQPQGGITYYSPEEQQTTQRHVPPMRPKAAIPILPPPPTPPPAHSDTSC